MIVPRPLRLRSTPGALAVAAALTLWAACGPQATPIPALTPVPSPTVISTVAPAPTATATVPTAAPAPTATATVPTPTAAPTATPAPTVAPLPTHRPAPPPLPVEGEARFSDCVFLLEVADTPLERQSGLMDRPSLPDNHAMIFVYSSDTVLQFWMFSTLIPLDIVFVGDHLGVVDVQRMTPEPGVSSDRLTIYTSAGPARYAIEMNAGRAEECGIATGDTVALDLPA